MPMVDEFGNEVTEETEVPVTEVAPEEIPFGTVKMVRPSDARINYVDTENVQDYLDSGLWEIAE
jgi:hypothetical protein